MSTTGPGRPSWRDLPPTPPYGPVAPPRPDTPATPWSDLAPPVVPPQPDGGRQGLSRGAIVGGIVGLLLVLGAGIALGLLLTDDEDVDTPDTPSTMVPSTPDPTAPPVGSTQDPFDFGTITPGGGGGGGQGTPSTELPTELGTGFDDLFGGGGDVSNVQRLFELGHLPEGYADGGSTVSVTSQGSDRMGEQITTLVGPDGEITVRATLGPEAQERLEELQTAGAESAEPVTGADAWSEDEQTLAWMADEDLLIEVHVPPGLEDELRPIAEGVVVRQ